MTCKNVLAKINKTKTSFSLISYAMNGKSPTDIGQFDLKIKFLITSDRKKNLHIRILKKIVSF